MAYASSCSVYATCHSFAMVGHSYPPGFGYFAKRAWEPSESWRARAPVLHTGLVAVLADLQHCQESFLGDVDAADAFHAAFAFFLLLQQFAFAADVAAVALGYNVLANGVDGFASDDLGADRGLNCYFKHLPGNQLSHFRNEGLAAFVGEVAMHDDGERVDRLAGDQDVEFDHGRFPVVGEMVVERGVAARDGLETIVKVENDFIERQLVV